MRNHFFPNRKAEYMTRERFAELGLTKADVGERDFTFRPVVEQEEIIFDDAVDAVTFGPNGGSLGAGLNPFAPALGAPKPKPAMEVEQLAVSTPWCDLRQGHTNVILQLQPNRALELMNELIPEELVFERRLINPDAKPSAASLPEPEAREEAAKRTETAKKVEAKEDAAPGPKEPEPVLAPLQAHKAKLEAEKAAQQDPNQTTTAEEQAASDKDGQDPAETTAVADAVVKTPEELLEEQNRYFREKREWVKAAKKTEGHLKVYGAITKEFLATHLRELMLLDPEASRIRIQPEDIGFTSVARKGKLDMIGTYEVIISTRVGYKVEPVKRTIKIVALHGKK